MECGFRCRPVVADRRSYRALARHRHEWLRIGEGIQAIFAVPVDVEAGERIVLYGGMRGTSQINAAVIDAASRAAGLSNAEVARRLNIEYRGFYHEVPSRPHHAPAAGQQSPAAVRAAQELGLLR